METIQRIDLSKTKQKQSCYHCGDSCAHSNIRIGEKVFCCNGCKMVYELLESNEMCDYYQYTEAPGSTPAEAGLKTKFKYLEDEDIRRKLVNFSDGNTASVTFYVPSMHCSSCVWLLENLVRLNPLIHSSRVNYLKKEVQITYEETASTLRQLAELLTSLGYEPQINLDSLERKDEKNLDRNLYLKIGVAGFCFINIMMFHFPEYLAGEKEVEVGIGNFFNYLSVALALPVLLYSSLDYFKSAWSSLRSRVINMDVPISLGVLTLFTRSIYEIFSGLGAGYMDSFTGLIFLLLVGKLFEKKTYDSLSFERGYKSYFPVSAAKKTNNGETSVPLERLLPGDRILIRSQELIPADSVLIRGDALIDYSFVTGESLPVSKKSGDMIYAGGKQTGGLLELDVIKPVNQSYLTELWNDEAFTKPVHSRIVSAADSVSRYFTLTVLSIAVLSAAYWAGSSWNLALNAFTAVLIVACPCALALSTPFTLGNTLRVFGWNKFYLKNTSVIEALAGIDQIVFDKTGTITRSSAASIYFESAQALNDHEKNMVYSLVRQSMHPLSRQLVSFLEDAKTLKGIDFKEEAGQGMQAEIDGTIIRIGSSSFAGLDKETDSDQAASKVYVSFNGQYRGAFLINNALRPGLKKTIELLKSRFKIHLLSGDNEHEQKRMATLFGNRANLHFKQTPFDKLHFIKKLQSEKKSILMVGDGLNDAGALQQSDAGISLTEDINSFSPASDAVLDAGSLNRLPDFIAFSKKSMRIILLSFAISFIYNITGMYFAVQGTLSPLIAALLMPASSISVVVFTTGGVMFLARRMNFQLSGREALL